jgi:hypothetical protein
MPWRKIGSVLAAVVLCATLGGCAGGMQSVYTGGFWVQPGKYDFLKCPDIAQRSVALSNTERNLVSLMERADQDAAGPLVNVMVYRSQLEQTRADIELLQQTSREKGCKSTVPLTQSPPGGSAGTPPARPANSRTTTAH